MIFLPKTIHLCNKKKQCQCVKTKYRSYFKIYFTSNSCFKKIFKNKKNPQKARKAYNCVVYNAQVLYCPKLLNRDKDIDSENYLANLSI